MAKITVDEDKCIGCGACVNTCPAGVLEMKEGKAKVVNPDNCTQCKQCENVCPVGAIKVENGEE